MGSAGDGAQSLLPSCPRFYQLASHAERRRAFVGSVPPFLRAHGFDGLEIAWVQPQRRDKQPLATLIKVRGCRRVGVWAWMGQPGCRTAIEPQEAEVTEQTRACPSVAHH